MRFPQISYNFVNVYGCRAAEGQAEGKNGARTEKPRLRLLS